MSYDPTTHGVSYSMLSAFMECRQLARFRIDGVKPVKIGMPFTYGGIVHDVLDTIHNDVAAGRLKDKLPGQKRINKAIRRAEIAWRQQNPQANAYALIDLELACMFAEVVLPLYFKHWGLESLYGWEWDGTLTEKFFKFEFQAAGSIRLPINTKMDGVFWRVMDKKRKGKPVKVKMPWLFETKCLSMVNEGQMLEHLPISLQNNIYLMAVKEATGKRPAGVMYNIIRRPCLRQRKTESLSDFAERISEDIQKRPEFYFIRMEIDALKKDMDNARVDLQGQVVDFAHWFNGNRMHFRNTNACIGKYGACTYLPICARNDWSTFATRGEQPKKRLVKSMKDAKSLRERS